jgi:hypothetical protein
LLCFSFFFNLPHFWLVILCCGVGVGRLSVADKEAKAKEGDTATACRRKTL